MTDIYTVPCNGCTRCCHGDAIRLLPEDDSSSYKTVPHDRMIGHLMLAHKENGECFYLGESGCTIQDSKPLMCKEMDCRTIANAFTFTEARQMAKRGLLPIEIWRRGKELLRSAN